jgi:hypothetical protein
MSGLPLGSFFLTGVIATTEAESNGVWYNDNSH